MQLPRPGESRRRRTLASEPLFTRRPMKARWGNSQSCAEFTRDARAECVRLSVVYEFTHICTRGGTVLLESEGLTSGVARRDVQSSSEVKISLL